MSTWKSLLILEFRGPRRDLFETRSFLFKFFTNYCYSFWLLSWRYSNGTSWKILSRKQTKKTLKTISAPSITVYICRIWGAYNNWGDFISCVRRVKNKKIISIIRFNTFFIFIYAHALYFRIVRICVPTATRCNRVS